MNIREYVLSEQNIYHAIYSVRSYLEDPDLLSRTDKELLNSLADPFDSVMIDRMIEEVRKAIEEILDDERRLFKTRVFFKPKGNEGFRPIHTANLADLIAMAAMLHPLVYEIPGEENSWKLNLSNYSRLIPQNFYGNKISLKPESLYERWNVQYKKYMQKASEYFRTFHKNGKYKYEVKLDLVDFFPSIDPAVVWGILLEKMPVVFRDEDVGTLKMIIFKLLVCEVTNLNTEDAEKVYYGDRIPGIHLKGIHLTKGLPQGLPQAYFFGKLIMTKIAGVFEKEFPGESVYYVDDTYIYTNADIPDRQSFEDILDRINGEYVVTNNDTSMPKLMVSSYYNKLSAEADKDEELNKYLNDRFNAAVWLIKSIEQRKQTIYNVASAVVRYQQQFFDKGDKYLKTLTLKQIADEIGVHESTVSRSINSLRFGWLMGMISPEINSMSSFLMPFT